MTVQQCKEIFKEAEWAVLSGPSKFFNAGKILKTRGEYGTTLTY
jgi:hypothetical protein